MRKLLYAVLILALALCSFGAGSALAQLPLGGEIIIKRIGGLHNADTVLAGQDIRFVIALHNNLPGPGDSDRVDIAMGFRLSSPDGATWDTTVGGPVSSFPFTTLFNSAQATNATNTDGLGDDTIGFFGAGDPSDVITPRQLPLGFNDTAFFVTARFTGNTAAGKHICIDSTFLPPSLAWSWIDRNFNEVMPAWLSQITNGPAHVDGQGYCWLIFDAGSDVTEIPTNELPTEFSLGQNYPNPFNPTTVINFEVPRKATVNLSVYNVLGQKVKTLVDKEMTAGKYQADWDGTNESGRQIASGIYFYKLEAENFVKTKKMILMK